MDHLFLIGESVASDGFGDLAPPIQIAIFLGAMSFATAALVSLTAFTRIIIVLSFVRRALSTQEIPPNQVILGLSFFLTLFVMAPTIENIHNNGIKPYLEEQNSEELKPGSLTKLMKVASAEVRGFMMVHTRIPDLELFIDLSDSRGDSLAAGDSMESPGETSLSLNKESLDLESEIPLKVLIPAFIISELKTAFIMGFCIYIPFLLIDLVISTVLMSLGMMMMPPVIVSTPCKLLLFVLVDGWHLLSEALVRSFIV